MAGVAGGGPTPTFTGTGRPNAPVIENAPDPGTSSVDKMLSSDMSPEQVAAEIRGSQIPHEEKLRLLDYLYSKR